MFAHENVKRFVVIEGFRGEKITCYQQ